MNENELQYKEEWKGIYRGINYEIVHWRLGWNYYLLIPEGQLPESLQSVFNLEPQKTVMASGNEYIHFNYNQAPIMPDLDWHVGITFYEKVWNDEGKIIAYRIGCDFLHLWDEGVEYSVDRVLRETKHSIDKLWELVPNLKVRCSCSGKYYYEIQTFLNKYGTRIAYENKPNNDNYNVEQTLDFVTSA